MEKEEINTELIENHNCDGMCMEETCSKKPKHFFTHIINGLTFFISVCDKHRDMAVYYGEVDNIDPPIVECGEDDGRWCFYCKYCGEKHYHGRVEGHRAAHCVWRTPYTKTGYIVEIYKKLIK